MRWIWAGALLLSGLAMAGGASAQDCDRTATQLDINLCLSDAYAARDARLNEVYGQVVMAFGPDLEEGLRVAQRSWIVYRDAYCDWEASQWQGGSGQPMARLDCLIRLTGQQIENLELHMSR